MASMEWSLPYIERHLKMKVDAGEIDPRDASMFKEFLADLRSVARLKESTISTAYRFTQGWTRQGITFADATTADIMTAVARIEDNGYTQNTLRSYIIYLKRFLEWMNEEGYIDGRINMVKIRKIRPPPVDSNTKSPGQMLSEEEIRKLVEACHHARDRAIVGVIYEGGMRPIEIVNLRWKDVKFDEYGVIITTDGKTGKMRYIRIVDSAGYLGQWRDEYPGDPRGDEPVFRMLYKNSKTGEYDPIRYQSLRDLLRRIEKEAKLDKKLTLYLFRHSRITNLVQQEYPESAIKMQCWGNLKTPMLATYTHVTGEYLDKVILDRRGIKKRTKNLTEAFRAIQCPDCATLCPPTARHCWTCGKPLTPEAAATMRSVEAGLTEIAQRDEEIARAAIQKIIREELAKAKQNLEGGT